MIGNDCDAVAGRGSLYAGRGMANVFRPGTGIGGGLRSGQAHGSTVAAAEIGHLRPGLQADRPEITVESLASGRYRRRGRRPHDRAGLAATGDDPR
jgi:glucokinase